MKQLTFIYTAEGLKVYEKPEEPKDYCTDFGDVVLICSNTFCKCDSKLKGHIAEVDGARSAALLVENPEPQFTGLMFQCGKHFKGIGKGEFQEIKIGDEFPSPDNIEWQIVKQIKPSVYGEVWRDTNTDRFHMSATDRNPPTERRQVIRLSVKQEEK